MAVVATSISRSGLGLAYLAAFACFMVAALSTLFGFAAHGAGVSEASRIAGPNACAECHKQEAAAWKGSKHFRTFRDMPRNTNANAIAQRMGVRRVKAESLCLNCHFTLQNKDSRADAIAGVSCESCHGAGQDWIKVHSGYSGKKADTETKGEAQARWTLATGKGMIRPRSLYRLAKNCYGCHVVPDEDLVNRGGHKAGSAFELVSWSQGEVRHNTWHSKGKENLQATPARRRMLYLVGLGVELEMALRAAGKATVRKVYALQMASRADRARKQLSAVSKAAPQVPEIAKMVEAAYSAGLKLNNESALAAAADGVSKEMSDIAEKYDGSTMAGLDSLIPAPDKFKGTARPAGTIN